MNTQDKLMALVWYVRNSAERLDEWFDIVLAIREMLDNAIENSKDYNLRMPRAVAQMFLQRIDAELDEIKATFEYLEIPLVPTVKTKEKEEKDSESEECDRIAD